MTEMPVTVLRLVPLVSPSWLDDTLELRSLGSETSSSRGSCKGSCGEHHTYNTQQGR